MSKPTECPACGSPLTTDVLDKLFVYTDDGEMVRYDCGLEVSYHPEWGKGVIHKPCKQAYDAAVNLRTELAQVKKDLESAMAQADTQYAQRVALVEEYDKLAAELAQVKAELDDLREMDDFVRQLIASAGVEVTDDDPTANVVSVLCSLEHQTRMELAKIKMMSDAGWGAASVTSDNVMKEVESRLPEILKELRDELADARAHVAELVDMLEKH